MQLRQEELAQRIQAPVDTCPATPNGSTTNETFGGRPNQLRQEFLKEKCLQRSVAVGPGPESNANKSKRRE